MVLQNSSIIFRFSLVPELETDRSQLQPFFQTKLNTDKQQFTFKLINKFKYQNCKVESAISQSSLGNVTQLPAFLKGKIQNLTHEKESDTRQYQRRLTGNRTVMNFL